MEADAPDGEGTRYNPSEDREDMWGIQRQDRRWFQLLTLIGGIAGSIGLTWLELAYGTDSGAPNTATRNIILGIGASFIAAGFVAWGLLHTKELIMAIADWIREATERRRQRVHDEARREGLREGREQGREQGYAQGRADGLTEGYDLGYDDSKKGNPHNSPHPEPDASD